jgi:hypothetical protein
VQRGIESERDLGCGKIVVDGLGYAYDLHSLLRKFVTDLPRSVATDGDDGIDAQFHGVSDYLARNVAHHFFAVLDFLIVKRIATVGGAENRSPTRQNAADLF